MNRFVNRFFLITFLLSLAACHNSKPHRELDFDESIRNLHQEEHHLHTSPKQDLPFVVHRNLDVVWDASHDDIIRLPSFSFTNQDKETISQETLKGRYVIANFFYMHCAGMCPLIMGNMKKIYQKIQNPNVVLLSHSLMPETDTPEKLKEFSTALGADERWQFVTGPKAAMYELARETYHADTSRGQESLGDNFRHGEHIYLIDPEGRIRGLYNGKNPAAVKALLADLSKLTCCTPNNPI
ncbi:SCO family protein [Pseudobacteriovorax antillogorgiicola]|uniref:Protein SCO1/2 n=1 Tax=Pseudobacteriovorax antillogorgiicola TaxID=1513793 RepID=A0A1Y6C3K6_9BACT|nr:SCO family protein [Pseudobacteriovorax antillogorgiicola]TCS49761.1 protein SCO1/2 [Pseudobacteriovorax antillogorgiicola]SMF42511.1 protein SCO1/2 [Pseudobacteriovorax antillogorgiicola]